MDATHYTAGGDYAGYRRALLRSPVADELSAAHEHLPFRLYGRGLTPQPRLLCLLVDEG